MKHVVAFRFVIEGEVEFDPGDLASYQKVSEGILAQKAQLEEMGAVTLTTKTTRRKGKRGGAAA